MLFKELFLQKVFNMKSRLELNVELTNCKLGLISQYILKQIASLFSSCVVIICPNIADLTNGQVSGEGHTYGSIKSVVCNHGFYLVGPEERICQSNGTWSGKDTKCPGRYQHWIIGDGLVGLNTGKCWFGRYQHWIIEGAGLVGINSG